eukprot:CAMPEP_0204553790 /NCGR_PEP_ID=MMETSP0661-20131031/27617_1 /ASSEMBLY_ACC=CAM_ASM_000606 /TAXON_ID=109239 /ORGANISM="Alexandrium margalefi, Strain AMGDE01CS-322" /LENGTH=159 /DNA_ID=CAMNT_0051560837 /DNA_START=11 /DNA_END=490 /DNA_ORIENTATION=-
MSSMGFLIERLEDGRGRCVGESHGQSHDRFDGSCFVELPAEEPRDAVQAARFSDDGCIQIFRLTRRHACPAGLLEDEGAGGCPPIWRVTAEGLSRGGLLARTGPELKSPASEVLLMRGSRVAQIEVSGNRMSFRKIAGDGPARGWVSLTFKGAPLLTRE